MKCSYCFKIFLTFFIFYFPLQYFSNLNPAFMLPINFWFFHLIKLTKYSLEFNNFAVQTRPHQIPFLRLLGRPFTLLYVRRSVGRLRNILLFTGGVRVDFNDGQIMHQSMRFSTFTFKFSYQ